MVTPNLQVGGQVVSFLTQHLGYQIPSPAILEKIGTAFQAVDRFAADNKIPVWFGKNDRKIEVMRRYLARQAATGRSGWPRSGGGACAGVHCHQEAARQDGVVRSPRPTGG